MSIIQFNHMVSVTVLFTLSWPESKTSGNTEKSVEDTKRLQRFIEVGVRSVARRRHIQYTQLQFAVHTQFPRTYKKHNTTF